jgi:hypothetical protein
MRIKIFTASAVGVVCGYLSAHAFSIGWWNIIFWGAAGIILGLFMKGKNEVMRTGLWFGFFLSLSFLLNGFQGTSDKLPVFILFSLALSIVGAFGGWLAVFLGSKLRSLIE